MPFGFIAALSVGLFAIALAEKKKNESTIASVDNTQQRVVPDGDGTYRDTYGNSYQRLPDGSLIAIPSVRL